MLGYVYVVTTNYYQSRSIFKIGFTNNLVRRLKLFNATRMDDDLFYCVRHWRTIHYSKLEAFLHLYLKEYRRKNEFFKVSLTLIENGAEQFAKTNGPQFFYEDVVLVNGELFDVQWISSKQIFIFDDSTEHRREATCDRTEHPTFGGVLNGKAVARLPRQRRVATKGSSRIKHANEIVMGDVISTWLSCVDVYGLVKFMSPDIFDRLVNVLKEACVLKQNTISVNDLDLSEDFRKLKL